MKLHGIQSLRALAALLVLVFHLGQNEALHNASPNDPTITGSLFENGYLGVDLFFVISGFIMMYVTANLRPGLSTVKNFMLARVFRIYPVYWLFAGILAIYLMFAIGTPYNPDALRPGDPGGWLYSVKSFLLVPQYSKPHLVVGWTLVHEMYFYVVFCGLLFLPNALRLIGLAVWASLVIAAFKLRPEFVKESVLLKFMLSPYTLEFITGAFAGFAFLRMGARLAIPLTVLGLVAFIGLMVTIPDDGDKHLSAWNRAIYFSLPSAILLYGAAGLPQAWQNVKAYKWLPISGDWSYSLYLSHPLTLLAVPVVGEIFARLGETAGLSASALSFLRIGSEGMVDNILFVVASFFGSFVVAALAFYLFERPVLRFLNRNFRSRQSDKEKAQLLEKTAP